MPLHRLYSPPGTFSAEEKAQIAKALTEYYTNIGLPAFYVNVFFIDVPEENLFIGGVTRKNFVRIISQQIARVTPPEKYAANVAGLEATWAPILKARGFDWEMHIEEHPRELWRVNGIVPPPTNSEGERLWLESGRPVEY